MKSGNLYSVLTVSLRSQNTSYSQSRCLPHLGGTTSHKEWLGESWICQVYIRTLDLRCALRLLQRQNHPHHYCPGWLKKKTTTCCISKQRCFSYQAITLQMPQQSPEGTHDRNRMPVWQSAPHSHPVWCSWEDSGWESMGCWPQRTEVQIKAMISLSLDPLIFPYIPKC